MFLEQSKFEEGTNITSVLEYSTSELEELAQSEVAGMLEKLVEQYPEDIFTLKLAHILILVIALNRYYILFIIKNLTFLLHIQYFNLGDSEGMLRVAKKASMNRANPFHHYLLGMLAFAYVECGYGNFYIKNFI